MKNNKNNKYTKGKQTAGSGRTDKAGKGFRPASANLHARKASLSGVKSRNMSISNIPNQRPGYAYLMEVGTSEMFNSLNSGISSNWLHTMMNLITRGDRDLDEVMALYNVGRTEESREAMTVRLGLQRPMSFQTRGRNMFYNRPNGDMISTDITPFDCIVAIEEWHKEWSREIGMHVKFLEHCIQVSRAFHAQRDFGPYGVSERHFKKNGNPFTPYEHQYYELMAQMDNPVDLNVPAHLVANLTLEDLAVYSLALLAPTSAGMVNDHWTFSAHTNIHYEGYMAGYNGLDFGLCTDNDGRPRYVVQPPATKVEARSTDDMEQSVIKSVTMPTAKLFVKDKGLHTLNGESISELPLGSVMNMLAYGVNPTEFSGDAKLPMSWLGSSATFTEFGLDMPVLLPNGQLAASVDDLSGNATSADWGLARHFPLTGSLSSWILSTEKEMYDRKALRMMPSPEEFKTYVREMSAILNQLQDPASTQLEAHTEASIGALLFAAFGLGAGDDTGGLFDNGLSREQELAEIGNPKIGDLFMPATIPIDLVAKLQAAAIDSRCTLKLWTSKTSELVGWCKMVADVLPPAYLATGYNQLTEIKSGGVLQCGEQFNMNRVTDMINLGSTYRPKFNPIKNIDANNGPFWDEANLERDWLSADFSSGDFLDQLEALETIFTGQTVGHGIGQGGITLAQLFAAMNPRWCDALWNFNSASSLSKHERYVPVPANRVDASVTFATAEGETKFAHMEMLIYRLFGTFRCNTTAPLADIDYTQLGSSTRLLSGSLGYNVNGIPFEYKETLRTLILPDHDEEADGPIADVPIQQATIVGDVSASVTAQFTGFAMAYERTYPNHDLNGMGVEIAWDADLRDSELDVSFTEGATTTDETGKSTTGFRTTTETLTTNPASIVNARLRGLSNGFYTSNVHVRKIVKGSPTETSAGAFATDIRFSDEGKSADLEVSIPIHKPAVTSTFSFPWSSAVHTFNTPAGSMYTVQNLKLKDVSEVGKLDSSSTGAKYKSYRGKVDKLGVGSLGLDTTVLDTITKLKVALSGCIVTATAYKATIEKGVVPLSPDHATTLPSTDADDVSGSEIFFVLYEFKGAPLPETVCFAPVGAGHSGVLAKEGWPQYQAVDGVLNAPLEHVMNWMLISAFPMVLPADVGVHYANIASHLRASGGAVLDVGSDDEIDAGGYMLPENEDIWYEQRLHELTAAILSYSEGMYHPTVLSTEPGRDLYPYHRELVGFRRALIQELTPELTKLHRLSVSPFATDNKNLLRVVKSIYVQTEYMFGYTALAQAAGPLYTQMSREALLNAQDVLVRSGQIGR